MSNGAGDSAVETTKSTHPPALGFFFWGEFAERSSYYGMRAILMLYLTKALQLSAAEAGQTYSAFKMACYFLPLVGGYIADRWLGRYWTIVGFSVPYVIGQFVLTVPDRTMMLIALVLLACGSGVIKPNISTLMGQTYDQKRPGKERLRSAAFMWFYLSINIGALISMFCLPLVRDWYILRNLPAELQADIQQNGLQGRDVLSLASDDVIKRAFSIAFQVPAWLMVASLLVFAAGKPFYAVERPEHRELTAEEKHLRWQTLTRLFGIFALVVLFWFGYEHNDSLWVLFNRDYVDLRVPFTETTVSPDQLQFLNSLFVILSIPMFNFIFARFDPDVKIFTPMRKVLAGFFLTAAAIGIMSVAGFLVQGRVEDEMIGGQPSSVSTSKVSIWWPAIAYVVLTLGEVLLYGTMLELAYAAAPKSMKGFVTACFLLTNTLGNFLNMLWMPMYGGSLKDAVAERGRFLPGEFFGITAAVVLCAGILFIFIGRRFERSYAEAADAGIT